MLVSFRTPRTTGSMQCAVGDNSGVKVDYAQSLKVGTENNRRIDIAASSAVNLDFPWKRACFHDEPLSRCKGPGTEFEISNSQNHIGDVRTF